MLGAGFSFALLAACVKLLAEHNVPTGQIVFFRAFVALAVLFVFMRWRGLAIATPLWKKQLSNNVVGIIALVAYFSSIKLLPLTTMAYLMSTMKQPMVRKVLRSSSDLSRLRIRRPASLLTGQQASDWPVDLEAFLRSLASGTTYWDDLWLRDGDVIEVPDRE